MKPNFFVFAANTDLGKTIFTTGLCRALTKQKQTVHYIKPLQTCDDGRGDLHFVNAHTQKECVSTTQIITLQNAVSPHRALSTPNQNISDCYLIEQIELHLQESTFDMTLIEGCGGVASPSAEGTPQCDVYRSLNLPVIFVADSRLGGISTSLSSLEMLGARGFDVACTLIFTGTHENAEYVQKQIPAMPVFKFSDLPSEGPLETWYQENAKGFDAVLHFLFTYHRKTIAQLEQWVNMAKKHCWWPFTQHKNLPDPKVVLAAHDDFFQVVKPGGNLKIEKVYDASASWWTQGLGHAALPLVKSMQKAAARFGHVMFPGNVHEPVAQLTEKLVQTVGHGWATRVFYADNGSTANEVALKMAFRKSCGLKSAGTSQQEPLVLGLKDSYHGDTNAALNATSPNIYKAHEHWYTPKGVWLSYPSFFIKDGKLVVRVPQEIAHGKEQTHELSQEELFCTSRRTSALAQQYTSHFLKMWDELESRKVRIGACLLEGVVQGAGGMQGIDPLFQTLLAESCQKRSIPVVVDEAFTGFWRLGSVSAAQLLGIRPDIATYAKLLSGGMLPISAVLSTEDVFSAFLGDGLAPALLHGHSYCANPIACAVAAESIAQIPQTRYFNQKENTLQSIWSQTFVHNVSHLDHIERVLCLGTLFAFELKDAQAGYTSQRSANLIQTLREHNLDIRPLGNVVYILAGFNTEPHVIQNIENVIISALNKEKNS